MNVGLRGVVTVCGELDAASAPTLSAALATLAGHGGTISVDLAGVAFIDAAGLNVFCVITGEGGRRTRIMANHASAKVRRVFELAELRHVLEAAGDSSRPPSAQRMAP